MRRTILFVTLAGLSSCLCLGAPSQEQTVGASDVAVRFHFAGFEHIQAGTTATTLTEIWNLPETGQLRTHLLRRLAQGLSKSFRPRIDKLDGAPAEILRPLLADLLQREFYLEVRRLGDKSSAWTLAVQLDPARIRSWQTNCSQLIGAWNCVTPSGTNHLSFGSANSWFVLHGLSGAASDESNRAGASPVFRQINTKGRPIDPPKNYLLKADVNLARLPARLPFFAGTNQPAIELTVIGKGSGLKTEGRVLFPQPLRWQLEKWQIPTNTIRDPEGKLISFTGAQGVAPWLKRQPVVAELGVEPVPNQLLTWGDSHAPFQIMAAARVKKATNLLARFVTEWMPKINASLDELGAGGLECQTNRSAIFWRGLAPVLVPYVRLASEPGQDFLEAGIFPVEKPPANPPPTELLEQLTGRTNLLYYDWEITQERLGQLRAVTPHLSTFLDMPTLETGLTSSKWLDAIQAKLVNTVTEITVQSPRELRLVRSSEIGLNGLELVAFAHWFESTNFPKLNLYPSFRSPTKPGKQAAHP
ncbi:MAG: hypothetical protein HYY23_02525 [Verrucomicrobia bacterium]|nr:hypothetical protein [Verrucomicrobiota bacterium]